MQFQCKDRLSCIQKCLCQYSQLKDDKSNAIVHYHEAKWHFPKEFNVLFGQSQVQIKGKKKRPVINESVGFNIETQSNLPHREESMDGIQMHSISYPQEPNESAAPLQ